jgi:HTH-type transcriptional regulator/antitoxin HigA
MKTKTKAVRPKDPYLKLVRQFPLRPLRSDKELELAIGMIDYLIDRDYLRAGEKDYLDVLSDLVERYETEKHPIAPLADGELLRHLLEIKGVSQVETARATRIAESTISDVLAGRRKLSRAHIGKLAHFFGVMPGAFTFDE